MSDQAALNPKNVWDRIAEIARKHGVKPIIAGEDYPLIGAYDSSGNYYDVEAVLIAARKAIHG